MRHVSVCQCGQCLRWHGHAGAYTAVPREALELLAAADLAWYRSSASAHVSVAAGTLDDASELRTAGHIFVADKPGYYEIADGLPQRQGGASPLIDAG